MSDEEDYLSDKFLAQLEQSSSGKPRTYHERRREVKRVSEQKNLTHRTRSRREIEEESRREGLSKSLFERAREEEDRARKRKRIKLSESDQDTSSPEVGEPEQTKNKALAMMLKMGYKEGQSLGRTDGLPSTEPKEDFTATASENRGAGHLVEPIPLTMWAGRQGLGSGRRIFAVAPSSQPPNIDPNGLAPVTQDEVQSQVDYRNRARLEFDQKRDLGRLSKARKTLAELDDKRGISFNILWIDPADSETIPEAMQLRLEEEGDGELVRLAATAQTGTKSEATQLRAQMRLDALRPLTDGADYGAEADDDRLPGIATAPSEVVSDQAKDFDVDTVQDTKDWLLLSVQDRLRFTLQHLRQEYFYCFWCGAQYIDQKEMDELCPGESEEAHD